MKKSFGTIVFYSEIKETTCMSKLYPPERDLEIRSCHSEKAKREKYAVWKLLEHAVREYLNLDFDNIQFTKTPNGKWICPDFSFSLSHTDGLVSVAISETAVGVDVEKVRDIKEGLSSKVLTKREREYMFSLPTEERSLYLLDCWVKKESDLKRRGDGALNPTALDSETLTANVRRLTARENEFLLSVSSENEIVELVYMEEI